MVSFFYFVVIVVGAIAGLVVIATVIGIVCHNSRKK